LNAEATICAQLSTYDQGLDNLTLIYYANGKWNEAKNINITGNTICGTTSHLSNWAVASKAASDWVWWYWVLIGAGAFIVVLAIVLLLVMPKKGAKEEEVPAEELYGEEEEEF
jgi:sugar phosphate permease